MSLWKGKRILVTGGTGFIGSFLVEELLKRGAKVRVPIRAQNYRALSALRSKIQWMEGDLRDGAYCAKLVADVDRVFHLASCRRHVEFHEKQCADVLLENVRMSAALIEGLRETKNVPVTFFSSANVPPSADVLTLAQGKQVDGYVLGKLLCDALWLTAAHQRAFPLLIVRPVGVYGPRDTFTDDGNVIPALMVKARKARKELEVWGNGKQERAFMYVEDLVGALFTLIESGATGIQYVTTPGVVTIRELSTMIRDLVHPGLPIRFNPDKHVGPRSIPLLPIHKSLQKFPWTSFEEGLKKTYESWK